MKRRLLLVEDDEVFLRPLQRTLELEGYEVVPAPSAEAALEALKSEDVDLMLTDKRLPGLDGVELVRRVKADHPDLAVVVMTAYGTIESAVEAMRLGAEDYLVKPFEAAELLLVVRRAIEFQALKAESRLTQRRNQERFTFRNIVARSAAMRSVFELLGSVADMDTTVLIHGETGVGKELLARSLHFSGARRDRPFVAVNCAAIPDGAVRVRAVRLPPRRLHRRPRPSPRAVPDGPRGHAAPGRDRRDAAAPPVEAPARDRGEEGDLAGRRPRGGHRRALHRHHQQGPPGRGRARGVPARPVLPAVRDAGAGAAAARASRGHPRSLPSTSSPRRTGARRRACAASFPRAWRPWCATAGRATCGSWRT